MYCKAPNGPSIVFLGRTRQVNEMSEERTKPIQRLVRLEVILEVDETLHGIHPEEIEWFREHVLMAPEDTILHSNVIGDEIGRLRSIKILEANEREQP